MPGEESSGRCSRRNFHFAGCVVSVLMVYGNPRAATRFGSIISTDREDLIRCGPRTNSWARTKNAPCGRGWRWTVERYRNSTLTTGPAGRVAALRDGRITGLLLSRWYHSGCALESIMEEKEIGVWWQRAEPAWHSHSTCGLTVFVLLRCWVTLRDGWQ